MVRRFFLSVLCFAAIDSIWLGVIAQPFYQEYLGSMLRESFLPIPAVAFYLVYLAGLNLFVIDPNQDSNYAKIFLLGGAFGCCCYATFDLTSLSVFKGFPPIVALVDIIWGSILTGLVATSTLVLERRFFKNS